MMCGQVAMLFSMGLGYVLCVIANKQTGLLKTVGYTLGIGILALSLLYSFTASAMGLCKYGPGKMGGMGKMGCPMMKMHCDMKNPHPMMK